MNEALFSLPVTEQITPWISLRKIGELPVLVIIHPSVRAAVTLQGAHLIAWQPSGGKPVIWVSEKTSWTQGKAIRGGVPVCWPWFGPGGEPAHGFARTQPWTLSAHDGNDQSVTLTLMLKSTPQTLKIWQHEFTLFARFRFSEQCEIELEAHGDFIATAALHSYFCVEDISQVEVSGLGNTFTDKVNNGIVSQSGDGKQTYPDRVDRIYTQPEDCTLIRDSSTSRTIEIYHHHHSDVVTWNPGPELSCAMSDMANEGYKTMVCVETAHISSPMQSAGEIPARLAATFRLRSQS
ncbi:D-hexose-6-phosphate mutarotase [Erwinia tracheiphila]|uniref:Putative glucose-6-phosphate 1-epimerase n=1 Tax=Erwinia tracheiphila TaxID=65700 RepID=A0A0M2K6C9_9GAMM|nr:D-hexose-6-phosphate mutarotase [Erwinia tracheiphila]EOS93409.1 aldose 1-epimerase [Erwinia tracheiphila PSU-1]KKF34494.1 glucose-6-phosphate 1-epimerase [Erwinia tracheiphila]UIA86164.1 D-hexose-6-phosphate mutarotase [Erwinia tracheiphila]UIA98380.1 D-hexose-6-phosphate mutarotase [Erwinia tracheiphila]